VRAWFEAHKYLDWLAQALITLGLATAGLLLVLFLLRLLRPSNLRRFFSTPGGAVRSIRLLGQQIEFFESLEVEEKTRRQAMRLLDERLTKLESLVWNRVLPKIEDDEPGLGL
jgi:hypothetical protein